MLSDDEVRSIFDECVDETNAQPNPQDRYIVLPHSAIGFARQDFVRLFARKVAVAATDKLCDEANSVLSDFVKEPTKEWHRDQIFERVMKIRKERHTAYQGHRDTPIGINFWATGIIWTGLLSSYYGIQLKPIPGWLASTMMAALKLLRIVWNPTLEDSYDDAVNYTAIAEELSHGEEER